MICCRLWDKTTDEEKKLFIRQADVYAAYLAYTDHEIGRVIQAVEDMGELDNTLIIYISGDNGASAEGSPKGTPSEVLQFNGVELPVAAQMKFYDVWNTQYAYSHFAVPWAWALDTPYKWTKQIPSFFGGTRQGMAISWPGHIKDKGGVRWQFHHVIDVVPTLLEVTGIPAPDMVDGIAQKPIEGVSMAYSFDKANADAPSPHKIQYFEMLGVQGLYNDGWMLSGVPTRAPWQLLGKAILDPATAFKFELYDVRHDWTQYTDVAAQNPEKVKEMTDLMFGEFAKYQVLPLDASVATRLVVPRPSLVAGRKVFTYSGDPIAGIPPYEAPKLLNTSYTITADIDVPEGGGEGVIVTQGGRFGGYGLYLLKGKPIFTWNLLDLKRVKWQAPDALTPGKHTLVYDFKYDGLGFATIAFNNLSGIGRPGTGTLSVDGKVVATETMERTIPLTLPWDETFDIGSDTETPIDDADYEVPFAFTGTDRQADDLRRAAGADGRGQEEADGGRARGAGRQLMGFPALERRGGRTPSAAHWDGGRAGPIGRPSTPCGAALCPRIVRESAPGEQRERGRGFLAVIQTQFIENGLEGPQSECAMTRFLPIPGVAASAPTVGSGRAHEDRNDRSGD